MPDTGNIATMARMRNNYERHIAGESAAFWRNVKEFMSYLGNNQCVATSLDDKDRFKVGVVPINEQKKIVMGVESLTVCDDHDIVKASRYKVYAVFIKYYQ